MDLLEHHLSQVEQGTFQPDFRFTHPRPQPLFALTFLILGTVTDYSEMIDHPDLAPVFPALEELRRRVVLADRLHQQFLALSSR